MKLSKYLGERSHSLLRAIPFRDWVAERTVDDDSDPPEVRYVFKNCGLQFNCDRVDEKIRTIFLDKEQNRGILLSDIPFNLNRDDVLLRFGTPSRSGEIFTDPILGAYGAWDRFEGPNYTIHFQYNIKSGKIEKITLMRGDAIPGESG